MATLSVGVTEACCCQNSNTHWQQLSFTVQVQHTHTLTHAHMKWTDRKRFVCSVLTAVVCLFLNVTDKVHWQTANSGTCLAPGASWDWASCCWCVGFGEKKKINSCLKNRTKTEEVFCFFTDVYNRRLLTWIWFFWTRWKSTVTHRGPSLHHWQLTKIPNLQHLNKNNLMLHLTLTAAPNPIEKVSVFSSWSSEDSWTFGQFVTRVNPQNGFSRSTITD